MMPEGEITYYKGKYTKQREPQASRLFQDFKPS